MEIVTKLSGHLHEHATRRLNRLYVPNMGRLIFDTVNEDGNTEVVEIDLRTYPKRLFNDESPAYSIDYTEIMPDIVGRFGLYHEDGSSSGRIEDIFFLGFDWYHEAGNPPSDRRFRIETYPAYPVWDSTPENPLTPTVTYSELDLTYPQKQARVLRELEKWRRQKRLWLLEAEQRSDLHPELVRHAGYWLRAGDAAVQHEFQDPDIDPIIVAYMIQEAIKGAADITTADEFAMRLNEFISLFPNGPDRAMLWVAKGEGNGSIGGVARLNLADSHQYSAGTLPDAYNPIDHNWMVANQPGAAPLDVTEAAVGDIVTASVFDPDQPQAGTIAYQWQKLVSDLWVNVASATTASYTIPTGTDAGSQFRCLVAYTDLYGPNQSAVSPIVTTT